MTKNRFFQSQGPFTISDIAKKLSLQDQKLINDNFKIKDIQNLNTAEITDITFFNSQKYNNNFSTPTHTFPNSSTGNFAIF